MSPEQIHQAYLSCYSYLNAAAAGQAGDIQQAIACQSVLPYLSISQFPWAVFSSLLQATAFHGTMLLLTKLFTLGL